MCSPQPIKPTAQYVWASGPLLARTTTQDSFQSVSGGGPPQSCKPHRVWESTAWSVYPTTTTRASFIPRYEVVKRMPFLPEHRLQSLSEGSKFNARSTAQDEFAPPPQGYVKVTPIYPKSSRKLEQDSVTMRSTSQDSYMPFPETYRKALPIYPKSPERGDARVDYSTTTRASYSQYPAQTYVQPTREQDDPNYQRKMAKRLHK